MSKTVAALTALKLSIDKRVALDEDVVHYLKRWPCQASGQSR